MSWRNHLKIHPACELFPPMSDEELKVLADDIRKHGMKSPVVLWHDGNEVVLIDGRNRLDAVERFAQGFANGPIIRDGEITWDLKYLSVKPPIMGVRTKSIPTPMSSRRISIDAI
jgi:hypothetical protein